MSGMSANPTERLRVVLRGVVQGVGLPALMCTALPTALALCRLRAQHSAGGDVEVEGVAPLLDEFLLRLDAEKPARAFIQSLEPVIPAAGGWRGLRSARAARRERVRLCAARHRHLPGLPARTSRSGQPPASLPVHQLHQLRAALHASSRRCRTTGPTPAMKDFTMCPDCGAEYGDPADRRFHAQPNALPGVRPALSFRDPAARRRRTAMTRCCRPPDGEFAAGDCCALKGLGGFLSGAATRATTPQCGGCASANTARRNRSP